MRKIFRNQWPLLFILLTFDAISQNVSIDYGWIRLLPPSIPNTAAYLHITNSSDRSQKILGIESSISFKTEFHRSYVKNGLMRMEPLETFSIGPRSTFFMPSDGTHIMLIGLAARLEVGQFHELCLLLDNEGRVCREIAVLNKSISDNDKIHKH